MTTSESARINRRVSERLRSAAFERRVTQASIAQRAKLSRSAVNEYLNGHKDMPFPAFLDICAAVGLDPHVLLSEVQDELRSE